MEQAAWKLQDDGSAEAIAWSHALRALRWHAEPELGRIPSIDELDAVAGASDEALHAAVLAGVQAAKACALALDRDALARYAEWLARQLERTTGEAEASCVVAIGFDRLVRFDDAETRAADACARASAASASAALIDATALLALAIAPRDLEEATRVARRGSRMARTESLPQSEYLANVVLARMRRLGGRPHHATRILTALAKVASRAWQPWIAWELVLAGGLEPSREIDLDAGGRWFAGARAFRDALFAAREGDRSRFDAGVAASRDALEGTEPFASDLASAVVAIDPLAAPDAADPAIASWIVGADLRTPPVLRGLSAHVEESSADEATAAFVVAEPGKKARRLVGLGHALAAPDRRIAPQRGRPGRVETIIAAIALAPDGIESNDLFRTVYGFEYSAPVHRDLFKQLVYRARGELEPLGTIRKEGERYFLDLGGRLLVPDPRCEQPLEDLVLRFLARQGNGSARATASTLKISLRKAQQALAQLAEEGAISVDKDGRNVSYRVEDTTFSEPTRV